MNQKVYLVIDSDGDENTRVFSSPEKAVDVLSKFKGKSYTLDNNNSAILDSYGQYAYFIRQIEVDQLDD
jgi:hypothetical protein